MLRNRGRQKNKRQPLTYVAAMKESQDLPKATGIEPEPDWYSDMDPDLVKAMRYWYPDANSTLIEPFLLEMERSMTQRPLSPSAKARKRGARASRQPHIIPNASNIEMFLARPFIEILGGDEAAIWFVNIFDLKPIRPKS
jgi:hypothetical protein